MAALTHLCVTGTQRGMTANQGATARALLRAFRSEGYEWMHNGLCVGVDEELFYAGRGQGWKIHGHPSTVEGKSVASLYGACDLLEDPAPPLDRNRAMVDASSVVLAVPGERQERLRSGTWATVRHARRTGKRVVLVYTDGSVEEVEER